MILDPPQPLLQTAVLTEAQPTGPFAHHLSKKGPLCPRKVGDTQWREVRCHGSGWQQGSNLQSKGLECIPERLGYVLQMAPVNYCPAMCWMSRLPGNGSKWDICPTALFLGPLVSKPSLGGNPSLFHEVSHKKQ